ncbi:MAG: acyl-CoA synthetase FdrA [Caldilineaceae bacterium]
MLVCEIRRGAYFDSIVLMQLQRALIALAGVEDAGVMMGTDANKDVLVQSDLLTGEAQAAKMDDLIITIRAESQNAAEAALAQVDSLLSQRSAATAADVDGYRPKTIESATHLLPEADWVLVSTPGRYAASVAREALRLDKHVFLYSDNVSVEDEVDLKRTAAAQGRLVMGPDCGTAILNGVGLGFANRVRRGNIGVIGASGTGLQQVTARIHQLGGGITHAIGTGGRDLSEAVGGITAHQALDLLIRDPDTAVIVLVSKPPAPSVVDGLLRAARATHKPVVVNFIGFQPTNDQLDNIYFARTLDGAAQLAVEFADIEEESTQQSVAPSGASIASHFAVQQKYLRGVFSGGTLAYEAQLILKDYLPKVFSNAPLDKQNKLAKATESIQHTIVDLGEDEFTVGRLHPMLDNELRVKRILQEANDPETAVLLLDVVLGFGSHPNPAAELVAALSEAQKIAENQGRHLELIAIVVGTDQDPQNLDQQIQQLQAINVHVEQSNEEAVRLAGQITRNLDVRTDFVPVDLQSLNRPLSAINVGLESFMTSLQAQEAPVIQVDWRPPAGGNERLASILSRMKMKK